MQTDKKSPEFLALAEKNLRNEGYIDQQPHQITFHHVSGELLCYLSTANLISLIKRFDLKADYRGNWRIIT